MRPTKKLFLFKKKKKNTNCSNGEYIFFEFNIRRIDFIKIDINLESMKNTFHFNLCFYHVFTYILF